MTELFINELKKASKNAFQEAFLANHKN